MKTEYKNVCRVQVQDDSYRLDLQDALGHVVAKHNKTARIIYLTKEREIVVMSFEK